MIELIRSQDYELIRRIMTHPRVYPHISDDGSPAVEQYRPIENDALWYVILRDVKPADEVETLGLWLFVPENSVCWQVHTCLLPDAWGPQGRAAAKVLQEWIWTRTPCRRIVTVIPELNKLAVWFAFEAGMIPYGFNPHSFLKNGELWGQVLMGVSKQEGKPCLQR
jgi:hypothetical protein